jgi:dipeptidyl aminopeptidase/acylaminoacyl peptidase
MNEKLKRYLAVKTERSPVWMDDDTIAFIRNDADGRCVWQMDVKTRACVQRTRGNERIWKLSAHPATGSILFCTDVGGDEQEQIYLLNKDAAQARNLTQSPSARHYFGGMSADGSTIYYACNRRSYATFDICSMDVVSRKETIVIQNSDNYNLPADDACSPDGRFLLYNKLLGESDNALWMADLQAGTAVRIPADDRTSAETNPAWRHDGKGFYLLSDRDSDFVNVWYYDIAAGAMVRRYEYGWDVNTLALSNDDRYLAVLVNEGGYTRMHIYDLTTNTEVNTIVPPKGVISNYQSVCWSPNGHRLLFTLSSGKRPEGIWLLDMDAERMESLSEPAVSDDDMAALVEPLACEYASFDGLNVPYWLYVPNGMEAKNLPVVVEIHGGPEGQETPDFNDFIQYLVSEGIAVVAPNVRGSTGYGHTYTHLDDVEKRLDSVRDIDSLVAHLVETGIADKNKIAVSGTSYGGFMTLSCASRYPGLWACAVDTVGMYNLVTFLENTSEYRRPHRESEYGTLEHDRETLYNVSPAAKIQDIRAPIMIIQGRNDPRVPVTEAEQAAEALRALGRTVEYLCYDDEGHGIGKMKNRLDCYAKVSAFLKRYLA